MKLKDPQAEMIECHCHKDEADSKQRRYTWINANGHVVSRKLTNYECQLEDDVEKLQDALFTISSHYAKIQFRLRQIANASPNERVCLLRELERITCQGIDENAENTEFPILLRDCQSMGNVRSKQRQIITELRSKVGDLLDDTGSCYCLETESEYNLRCYEEHQGKLEEIHEPNCPCIVCQETRLEQRNRDREYLSEEEQEELEEEYVEEEEEVFARPKKSKTKKKRKKSDRGSKKGSSPIRSRRNSPEKIRSPNSVSRRKSPEKIRSPKYGSQPIIGCTRLSYSELVAHHQGSKVQSRSNGTPKSSRNSRNGSLQSSKMKFPGNPIVDNVRAPESRRGSSRNSIQSSKMTFPEKQNVDNNRTLESRRGSSRSSHQASPQSSRNKFPERQNVSRRESISPRSGTQNYIPACPCKDGRGGDFTCNRRSQESKRNSSPYAYKEIPLQPCNSKCSNISGTAPGIPPTCCKEHCPRRNVHYQLEASPSEGEVRAGRRASQPIIKSDEKKGKTLCEQRSCRGSCTKDNACLITFPEEEEPTKHRCKLSCRRTVKKELKFCEKESCSRFQAQRKEHETAKPKKNDTKNPQPKDKHILKAMFKGASPLFSVISQPHSLIGGSRASCLAYPNKYGPQNVTKNDRRYCKLFCSKLRKGFEKQKANAEDVECSCSNKEREKDEADTDC